MGDSFLEATPETVPLPRGMAHEPPPQSPEAKLKLVSPGQGQFFLFVLFGYPRQQPETQYARAEEESRGGKVNRRPQAIPFWENVGAGTLEGAADKSWMAQR